MRGTGMQAYHVHALSYVRRDKFHFGSVHRYDRQCPEIKY
jgi:hypothetical protein